MKPFFAALLFLIITSSSITYAQKSIDKVKFFTDTAMINATLTFNIKRLMSEKDKIGRVYPATFSCKLDDGSDINDHLLIEVRGHFRRGYCYLPPLKLIYDKNPASAFYSFKSVKLVSTCMTTWQDDQNLLKEYMIYKIYNMLSDKSFRVRLLNLSYQDSSGKKKTIKQHAFITEDIKQLAKRNSCVDWTGKKFATEATDRGQTTLVSVFEYMIGNTDWSVPVCHNIKILHSKTDSLTRPYIVPYDFDYSGFVNTTYAIPDERLGIESVRDRLYRGFPRSIEELNAVMAVFNKQKENIYAAINNFSLFTPASKKEMTTYLDDFYRTINNQSDIRSTFIDNARTQ